MKKTSKEEKQIWCGYIIMGTIWNNYDDNVNKICLCDKKYQAEKQKIDTDFQVITWYQHEKVVIISEKLVMIHHYFYLGNEIKLCLWMR